MGTVHRLIELKGRRGALEVAAGDRERRAIEAAAIYMGDEQSEIAFLFSGWAHACLPHRKIADDAVWRVETEHVTLAGGTRSTPFARRRARVGRGAVWVEGTAYYALPAKRGDTDQLSACGAW